LKRFSFLYLVLLVLYGVVGYLSFGYDDEFTNISLVEKFGFEVVSYIQTVDVHPPGSYFINWLLFSTLGKWELVRLVISLITAGSLIYAINWIKNKHGVNAGFIAFVLLGLNPAILLWCTGVRWYALFVPVLIWLSIVPSQKGLRYWGKCFGGLLCLGYLGYAVFIVTIPILVIYWIGNEQDRNEKIKSILKYGTLALILYLYQLFIFLTVHFKNKDSQISTAFKSISGFLVAQFSNQGVFPLSVPGILSSVSTLGIITIIFYTKFHENIKNKYFISYSLSTALLIISGLAGKFRNLVIISPWQAFWISTSKINEPHKKYFLLFLSLLTAANLWGDFNVATHQNTTKNSWNLPVKQIVSLLAEEKRKCGNDLIVLTHDPSLTWILNKADYQVLGPYSSKIIPNKILQSKHNCLIFLKTYAGSINQLTYENMIEEVNLLGYVRKESSRYGRDDFFYLKNKLDPRFQEYMIEVTKYYEVDRLTSLQSWFPNETESK
jgi:hypothetical protein